MMNTNEITMNNLKNNLSSLINENSELPESFFMVKEFDISAFTKALESKETGFFDFCLDSLKAMHEGEKKQGLKDLYLMTEQTEIEKIVSNFRYVSPVIKASKKLIALDETIEELERKIIQAKENKKALLLSFPELNEENN